MTLANDLKRQIDRRAPTATGDAGTIDDKEIGADLDIPRQLFKGVVMLVMHGRPSPRQQTRASQKERACVQADGGGALSSPSPQCAVNERMRILFGRPA